MGNMNSFLKIRNISKLYPGVVALDNVCVDFESGEVHAIVGENGAGKSTLMKILSGSIEPTAGEIILDEKCYSHFTPHHALKLGISTIYQEFSLVNKLSIAENIYLGKKGKYRFVFSKKHNIEKAKELINQYALQLNPEELVKNLSPALQQMVEILRAISRDVRILIMDEPTAPLSITETEIMFEVINKLKAKGVTILYISHRMEEIFKISDRVTVLRDGKYIATLQTSGTNEKELVRMMVGRNIEYGIRDASIKLGPIVLNVDKLRLANSTNDVSFTVRKGEILGFGGLVGSGRTEIMNCLYGANAYKSGNICLNGKLVSIRSPKQAINAGIALIPEDRKQHGLILGMSVTDNIAIAVLKKISVLLWVNINRRNDIVRKYIDNLGIKTPSLFQLIKHLSGGNQQKVVLAKMLATNSEIIILDEPTRGIDVGAKFEIYEIMNELTRKGKSILMVSSDMQELLSMSDRIIVINHGRIMGEITANEYDEEKILRLASGII